MTIAAELANWAWTLRLDDVPEQVQAAVKRHLLDGLGTAIAAGRAGEGSAAIKVALDLGGPPESTVLGTGTRVAATSAALANGVLIHALDFDDTHATGVVHASAVVLPAMFAIGESSRSTGREALLAAVAGYETVCRIARAAPHAFHARGLHATSMCGVFSSALVTARLSGLPKRMGVDALGIAGSLAAGVLESLRTGASTKQLHPGLASHSGILAARLAGAGAEGPDSILEGKYGFYLSLAGIDPEPDAVLGGLGSEWESSRITIKPYPACQLMHAALDAAHDVLRQLRVDALASADVLEVIVELHPDSLAIVGEPNVVKVRPRTPYEAKFSVQWSLAAMLIDGGVTVGTFAAACLGRPDVRDVAARVRVIPALSGGAAVDAPGRVTLRLVDGQTVVGTVPCSAGGPQRPLDETSLTAKLTANAGGSSPLLEELVQRLASLGDEDDLLRIVALADLLASPKSRGPAPCAG